MEMNIEIIIVAAAAASIAAVATLIIVRGHFKARLEAQDRLHRERIADMEKMAAKAEEKYGFAPGFLYLPILPKTNLWHRFQMCL